MNSPTTNVQKRIRKIAADSMKRSSGSSRFSMQSRNMSGLTKFLGVCILFLSLATAIALTQQQEKTSHPVPAQPSPLVAIKDDIKSIQANLAKINEKLNVIATRTWLLSVANNENAIINQMPGSCDGKSSYIVFDREWKINRMPSHLMLDDRQKEVINKNVK